MYDKFKNDEKCEIEIFCNGWVQGLIFLQTSINDDRTYFIKKYANVCNESVLILSENDSFSHFWFTEFRRNVGGLPNLSLYNGGVEDFLSIYEKKPFQRYINIETLSDDDLRSLLSKIHYQGRRGNGICLVIDDLNSILNRAGFKNNPSTNSFLDNTFSYNSTLVCDGIPIGNELYSKIAHYTIKVQHLHGQLYDVIYENNSKTLENRTLEDIKLVARKNNRF